MQGAFIDALVSPVFKLLADLLPILKNTCIEQLQINRLFWTSMQNRSIVTSSALMAHLKRVQGRDSFGNTSSGSSESRTHDYPALTKKPDDDPIPGIPANAPKEVHHFDSIKRLTVFQNKSQYIDLNGCDESDVSSIDEELGRHTNSSPEQDAKQHERDRQGFYGSGCESVKRRLNGVMDSTIMHFVLLMATVYALFAS